MLKSEKCAVYETKLIFIILCTFKIRKSEEIQRKPATNCAKTNVQFDFLLKLNSCVEWNGQLDLNGDPTYAEPCYSIILTWNSLSKTKSGV